MTHLCNSHSAAMSPLVAIDFKGTPGEGAIHVECHYCGYEAPATVKLSRRCPKCGGTACQRFFEPGALLPSGRKNALMDVRFRLSCAAEKAYVVCNSGCGSKRVVEMNREDRDIWVARLALAPGTYGYRFYVYDGKLLIYQPASDERCGGMDRLSVVPNGNTARRQIA